MTATKTYGFPLVTPAQFVTVNVIAADLFVAPAISLSPLGENPPAVMVEFWDNDREQLTTVNIAWDGHITSSETWSDRLGNVDNLPELAGSVGADLGGVSPSTGKYVSIDDEPVLGAAGDLNEAHWRLFLSDDGLPAMVRLRGFEYFAYAADRFLDGVLHQYEEQAEAALARMLTEIATSPTFYRDRLAADELKTAGSPMTRRQALLAYLV